MKNLLKTKADAFHYLFDLKATLYYKAQEAEDLHNTDGAKEIRAIADQVAAVTKRMAVELSSFPLLQKAADFEQLKQALTLHQMERVEAVLAANAVGEIEFIPGFSNGSHDWSKDDIRIRDEWYEPTVGDISHETKLVIIKWYASHEDTGYLIEVVNSTIEP